MVLINSRLMGMYINGRIVDQLIGMRLKIGSRPLPDVNELSHKSQHKKTVSVIDGGTSTSVSAQTQCDGMFNVSVK